MSAYRGPCTEADRCLLILECPLVLACAEANEMAADMALAGEGCDDAAGSKVAQVRSGLDLPDQSQSNSPSTD